MPTLLMVGALLAVASLSGAQRQQASGGAPASIYDVSLERMKVPSTASTSPTLAAYRGDVLLIVNIASECGFVDQLAGLEALHRRYASRGLRVIGFPSNDFAEREPRDDQKIVQFCRSKYDVSFPLYAKTSVVKGPGQTPLYRFLGQAKGEVAWNFEKYLVGRDGQVIAHFGRDVAPDDPELVAAIGRALGKKP